MTTYVVLWQRKEGTPPEVATHYEPLGEVEARSAEHARRLAINNGLPPAPTEELEGNGLTLFAVPLRNWDSGTYQAMTERKIRSA